MAGRSTPTSCNRQRPRSGIQQPSASTGAGSPAASQPGRPAISKEMQALIRKLSGENPLWSAERIRDTLLLLGINSPCEDTIRKYMTKPRGSPEKSSTWLPFLRNHLDVSWAIDFFTVSTICFDILYVFLVFHHGQRQVLRFAATFNPSMLWVIQQLREAMPFEHQPRYMFRDNDGIYGHGVRGFLKSCGIEEVRISDLKGAASQRPDYSASGRYFGPDGLVTTFPDRPRI